MPNTYHKPLIYLSGEHRPMVATEFADPQSIPVSAQAANVIQVLADGLYVGDHLKQDAFYVSSTGSDVPGAGTKAAPFQTLDYCLAQISAASPGGTFFANAVIALHANQAFNMTQDFQCGGNVTFTYYGDANYGDFDGPFIANLVDPAIMFDLQRPVIAPQGVVATQGMAGVRLLASNGRQASCTLRGIRINLPASIVGANSLYCDFVTGLNYANPLCNIIGSIINVSDIVSEAGLFGLLARCNPGTLSQYASQFLIQGIPISGTTTPQVLIARQAFLKFYPDYLATNQTAGALTSGSAGSAIMNVNWPIVGAGTVLNKPTLGTFPLIGVSYGLGTYFSNMVRDNQARPLNVICAAIL